MSASSSTSSRLSALSAMMASVVFEASAISFLVNSLKRGSVMSMAKMVSLMTRQAVVSSENCGLNEKPSLPKKPLVLSKSLTGRFTKIIWVMSVSSPRRRSV